MSTIKQILTFAYESEYESAYDLSLKRNFSNPKIYSAGGDLTKRWYVYFSFRDPKTGKLKRVTPFYGDANTYKTKEERLSVLVTYRKVLLRLLKQGYSPYEDNTELYQRLNSKEKPLEAQNIKQEDTKTSQEATETPSMDLREAFDFGLKLKEKLINSNTKKNYENKIKLFLHWLADSHPEIKTVQALDKKILTEFLNHVLANTSPRNRNNYRTDLSSIMQVLEDNDIIGQNFIKKIPVLKSIPKRNKTYTDDQQEEIFSYLEEKDPLMLLFIKFISYNFLRPKEVCRLTVGDINLREQIVVFKAKNKPLKTKRIPSIILNELPDLSQMDKDLFLFTPSKIGGTWDAHEDSRREHFTNRFKRVVKDPFGLDENYGLYSFRHTFITSLYRTLVEESSPFEAKSELMQITGHSSMAALEKYLRDIDAELPSDYSNKFKKRK
ncbi:tyrosine-type recombinase/integrase [Yeosuana marina]|uniref:tyrosine-type recombinase/integrase n=1 Tax=Yeosuana marina TaxID=1565536 RepID=UPI00142063B0|nr:tyrosine-type recombinase/integrase [Yeosuana marina]